jgi:hypothetical protein
MPFFGHITDADLEVAVHTDPSTDHVAWQQGVQTIEEFFGPDGTFWSEPITPNGEYIADNSVHASGEASSGIGSSSGNEIGIGTSRDTNIVGSDIGMSSSGFGGALNDLNINSGSDHPQEYDTTAINATPQYYVPHHFPPPQSRCDQQQYPGSSQSTISYSSSPTAQETTRCPGKNPLPTVEIKQPTQYEKMHAELSYPITPQLGTPYTRGRKTSATKGAAEMRREMEKDVLADPSVKCVLDGLKSEKPQKSEKGKKGGQNPIRPRKQPKRAAKSKNN